MGYIVVPLFHRHEDDLENVIETGAFSNLLNVIRGLGNHDERITDVVRQLKRDMGEDGIPKDRNLKENQLMLIELSGIEQKLATRLFDEVIDNFRLPWRTFEEAREFAHGLNIKGKDGWVKYSKSPEKPRDIPVDPSGFYKDKGWVSWGDWLGTGSVATFNKQFRRFEEAREFAHGLNINSQEEWKRYSKSGNKPTDIPSYPDEVYQNKGWVSWGDWLGPGRVATFNKQFRRFEEAREFVRKLNLKSFAQWGKYSKSGKKPVDIPSNPNKIYKDRGWVSLGDWLGTGNVAPYNMIFRKFEDAKAFVHGLCLDDQRMWRKYAKSGNRPSDIPANPARTYAGKGWVSMGDWLGTKIATHNKNAILKNTRNNPSKLRSQEKGEGLPW